MMKCVDLTFSIGPLARRVLIVTSVFGMWSTFLLADDQPPSGDGSRAANAEVERVMREFRGIGDLGDESTPLSPKDALNSFELDSDLQIELVAAEPQVMQPVYLSFDEWGRMWVVQYLQYPFPEGLKVVKYDQYLRAVFDHTPLPPPQHVPGKDKITVFEDRDRDGTYEHSEDVITGLNITTAALYGYGGLWVLNPPYLLFYPDHDGDGRPAEVPEVKLSGFGIEDTHAVANSLAWGPDGWLYGAMGSTTTAKITSGANSNVEFEGQCIWRYHPRTEIFEVFAEGGGNTFSLEFDSSGRAFSGTNIGDSRGMFYPQGAFGEKNFGKHGPLTNPAAFGFINHMRHEGDASRFPQTFVIYEGGALPDRFQGAVIAANALHHRVWLSQLHSDGSTYRTTDEPVICTSSDRWFRPVDVKVGPDGAVYLADWYDTRLTHVDPRDNWHKTSGRIYRIRGAQTHGHVPNSLAHMSLSELVQTLDHPNKWQRQTAVRLLSERLVRETDSLEAIKAIEALRERLKLNDPRTLEVVWVLHQAGMLSESACCKLLQHPQADVRRWCIRFLGDGRQVSAESAQALAALAATEDDVQVRSQLASSAKRLSVEVALPIINALLRRDLDMKDPHLPLLIWWALETHCGFGPPRPDPHLGVPLPTANGNAPFQHVLQMFEDGSLWIHPISREFIAPRLMRRFAQEGLQQAQDRSQSNLAFEACDQLLAMTPPEIHPRMMSGLLEAGQGRDLAQLPERLRNSILEYQNSLGELDLVLGTRIGQPEAVAAALQLVGDEQAELPLRLTLISLFGTQQIHQSLPTLLKLLKSPSSGVKIATLHALSHYTDPKIARQICNSCRSTLSEEHGVRASALRVLASREEWSQILLKDIADGSIRAADVPSDAVQTLRYRASPEQQSQLDHLFGPASASDMQKQQEVQRVRKILGMRPDRNGATKAQLEAGHQLFKKHCATCHMLFDEGGKIGPNLTGYERSNLEFLLTAIADPSAGIREEFIQFQIATVDGRVMTGMITDRNSTTIQLRDANNQLTIIPRSEIDELQAMKTSLMPDGILKKMSDEEIGDLFAYLMKP